MEMSLTLDGVLQDAMTLPEADRWQLVEALMVSLEKEPAMPDDSWREEIHRRWAEYKAGSLATYSWDEVKSYARNQASAHD
jgi:putative addiction module component (TIGR02574 family)